MPGLVVFRRRWSVGSDDLVVPGVFLFVVHLIWLVVITVVLVLADFDRSIRCVWLLWQYCLGYAGILVCSAFLDLMISMVAMRGGILDVDARAPMRYLIYIRLSVMVVEMVWLTLAVVWLSAHYQTCPVDGAKDAILGMVICNWLVVLSIMLTVWCVFDAAGRSWVKMKKYQRSMRESESRFQYKRSGNRTRNWRQRKVLRAYQDSWDHRCRLLFCCIRNTDRNKNSFADIARLLSDFFRDLDVVPSDVVAGLVLLRKFQKIEQEDVVNQRKNDTYEYLSGVPVTSNTKFLPLGDAQYYQHFQAVIHYMHYALAAYGWPMFLMTHSTTGLCQLCTKLSCSCFPCCCPKSKIDPETTLIEDNCCHCNYAALRSMVNAGDVSIVYATYHVDVNETPFFVAIDYTRRKVVVSIRGTLSMKDVITDLNAESETLPLTPPREDWLGHKGMVHAAVYIRDKLITESILTQALATGHKKLGEALGLVLVGHSLGAGTAAILAILLRQTHPDLQCFAYSPPGGLLSMPAVQYTKSFITSVVLGKDVVPRIGLHQMESLRADLINAIKRSKDPKWKTISCSVMCCGTTFMPTSAVELKADSITMEEYRAEKNSARAMPIHPSDSSIALTLHQPLYPPGSIIHVVRHHPTKTEQVLKKHDPVYQALWANNTDFDEVLISPVMIQDHMPDKVLDALYKVITSLGPAKPQRSLNNNNNTSVAAAVDADHCQLLAGSNGHTGSPPHKLCLETSFTSIQPRTAPSDSRHLPWEFASLVGSSPAPPLDLIHDDWFGLAPLATPESLSEVSSISSRTSTVKKKQSSVTFVDAPVKHHFTREDYKHSDNTTSKSWKSNLKQNFFSAENFICVKSKTQSDSSPENGSLINTSNDKFYSAESVTDDKIGDKINAKDVEHLDEESTSESSPLLSSLHLLTDEKFQNLFKGNLTRETDDSISSGSFKSVSSEMRDLSTSMDSVTVNAEVHRTEDKTLWTENSDLLEDIERSLNLRSSDSPCGLGTMSPGNISVDIEPSPNNSEKSDVKSLSGGVRNKYVYPILSIARGESSV
ncbi:diacylglycerol lipase-alpha isoform X2 [Macrosteles quadrilineatus]|uniref:diacylglycerol lipase-alpha isoform X2 n=1 Tax=Macrosteles quadrilineatus TaxID=74068 RepID=UPI0023E2F5FF|nr:diacylglycerol lipase-alpha isoform X2 [Macrosteles quadrilineatus]